MSQPSGARILVVDDDPSIRRAIRTNLERHGFPVAMAGSVAEALTAIERGRPELILLDLGLPDGDGLTVIRQVRERAATPIVVLSVRGGERDKVAALELGADDYVTKPFGVDELLARVRVALRHAARPEAGVEPIVRIGELAVDLEHRRVHVGGREVHLTPTEYDLLKVMVQHPNKVLTPRMLLQLVWGLEYGSEGHYLHVYIARLRKKLETDPQQPRYLVTEPGVGYRLLDDAAAG